MPYPTNKVFTNFVGGEVSDLLNARSDLPLYLKSLQKCQNFIVLPQGGGEYRGGSRLVKNTRLNKKAWFMPFQFNDSQSYLIEMTDSKMRFFTADGAVLLADKTITGVTNASPGVVTSNAHGYSNGDEVYIDEVEGMTELNGRFYLVANVTANTFSLTEIDGTSVGTLGYGTYSGGGVAAKVYEITSPYTEDDIEAVQSAQSLDTIYMASRAFKPRKLVRTSATSWAVSTPTLTADPFGADASDDCPGAVALTDSGRLIFGGTNNDPQTVWGSKAPSTGVTAFEDFTTGANDVDAYVFSLIPIHGKVDDIKWLASTNKVLVIGAFGSVRIAYGASFTVPITPTSITAKSVNNLGAAAIVPVSNGESVHYIQRGEKVMRSFEYNYTADQYVTENRNLVSQHITNSADYKRMVGQNASKYDAIWAITDDGKLWGLTYHQDQNISGWHQHQIGGQHRDEGTQVLLDYAKVLDVGIMPRASGGDMLWLVVEREINMRTVRTIEYIDAAPAYPRQVDFYSGEGEDNREADTLAYYNALWEAQKLAVHLDMSTTYDGSVSGSDATISLVPNTASGEGIVIQSYVITGTVEAPILTATDWFTSDMVGREIWKKYDVQGGGGGRATITEYIDARTVIADVTSDFDSVEAMRPGQWYITSDEITGLNRFEGEEVTVVADGGVHPNCTVQDGAITLDYQASVVHVGIPYTGIIKTMNIDSGGITGSGEAKTRAVYRVMVDLLHTCGLKVGTDEYSMVQLDLRNAVADQLDRAAALASGTVRVDLQDTPSETEKYVVFVQDEPLPATVLGYDVFIRTTDEGT